MVCEWFGLKTTQTICEWFGLKTTRMVFSGLASKSVAMVSSGLTSKPATTGFSNLASKLVVPVSHSLASKSTVGFLVEPQNQGGGGFPSLGLKTGSFNLVIWASKSPRRFTQTICEWFGLKTTRMVFAGLASKSVAMVSSGLASKSATTVFSNLASKLVVPVSPGLASKPTVGFLVEPQNQGGGGFPSLGLKTGSFDLVIWASKSLRRFLGLGLKTMWASVCRLRHKTDGVRPARDTC
jgi:hypothetical protein